MSMKLCKEVLYGLTLAIEQLVLQNSARLIQHTASASVASTLSTGAATFGKINAGSLCAPCYADPEIKLRGYLSLIGHNSHLICSLVLCVLWIACLTPLLQHFSTPADQ